MKTIYFILLLSIASLCCFSQKTFNHKTVNILPESSLTIKGDTNISEFQCEFNTALLTGVHQFNYTEEKNSLSFKDAVLTLKNKGFDCGNRAINKDFHALLQTEKHPTILLELQRLTFEENAPLIANLNIKIAGKEKSYSIPINIMDNPIPTYKGLLKLNIKDFGLTPPKKLFGLIVIKEEIEINFNLAVQLLD